VQLPNICLPSWSLRNYQTYVVLAGHRAITKHMLSQLINAQLQNICCPSWSLRNYKTYVVPAGHCAITKHMLSQLVTAQLQNICCPSCGHCAITKHMLSQLVTILNDMSMTISLSIIDMYICIWNDQCRNDNTVTNYAFITRKFFNCTSKLS